MKKKGQVRNRRHVAKLPAYTDMEEEIRRFLEKNADLALSELAKQKEVPGWTLPIKGLLTRTDLAQTQWLSQWARRRLRGAETEAQRQQIAEMEAPSSQEKVIPPQGILGEAEGEDKSKRNIRTPEGIPVYAVLVGTNSGRNYQPEEPNWFRAEITETQVGIMRSKEEARLLEAQLRAEKWPVAVVEGWSGVREGLCPPIGPIKLTLKRPPLMREIASTTTLVTDLRALDLQALGMCNLRTMRSTAAVDFPTKKEAWACIKQGSDMLEGWSIEIMKEHFPIEVGEMQPLTGTRVLEQDCINGWHLLKVVEQFSSFSK